VLSDASDQIVDRLADDALVLDVGGWNDPLPRANWVIDLMPYETRTRHPGSEERFDAGSWVQQDICDREPWPFDDGQFDFAVCSHTLEDVRDPVWVCSELNRIAKGGYIEVPSRLEEQTWGVNGEWAGWSHHHWLVDLEPSRAQFTLKPHFLHARDDLQISYEALTGLPTQARVASIFWEGELSSSERIFYTAEELEAYLRDAIEAAGARPRSEESRGIRDRVRSVRRAAR
jgi:hypothetical protein